MIWIWVGKDLGCPARVFLEPNPLKPPVMCSPASVNLAAPRIDLAEVELTEEEVKMLTVSIIEEARLMVT